MLAGWQAGATPPGNFGTQQSWPTHGAVHWSDGSRPEADGALCTGAGAAVGVDLSARPPRRKSSRSTRVGALRWQPRLVGALRWQPRRTRRPSRRR
eukprot:2852962-Alexandrium_andersonii.AAC.1